MYWTEFRCGRISTSDADWGGQIEVVTLKILDKNSGICYGRWETEGARDHHKHIIFLSGIDFDWDWGSTRSFFSVKPILIDHLSMRIFTRWVPRLLKTNHNSNLVPSSKGGFVLYYRIPEKFLHSFITMDKIWIHPNTAKIKEQKEKVGFSDRIVFKKGQAKSDCQ